MPSANRPLIPKRTIFTCNSCIYNKTPPEDIIVVMADLHVNVLQDNYMLKYVMGIHSMAARNDNVASFVDFCRTNHLVIGDTFFQHKPCHKVSCISPSGRTSNQIDHFVIARRFRGCFVNVHNKRAAHIGNWLDHYLMAASMPTAVVPKNNNIMQRAAN